MFGTSQTIRSNLAATTKVKRARQPGAHAARAIEIANTLTPGERNIMNQTGKLPPIIADKALVDGYDDYLLAKLVRDHLDSTDHLREAELRKVADRYAPTRPQRDDVRRGGGTRHPYKLSVDY